MTYAVVTDVAVRLGRTVSDAVEIAQINAWIADAEAFIANKIPDIAARVDAGRPTADTVKAVVAAAVCRKVLNPEGKKDQRVDDFSYGLHPDAARADIHFTDDEWALLTPDSGAQGAFTAVSTRAALARSGQWLTPDVWATP